ncbi:ABC transporter ATP-binding protein [Alphaproteobacteria bacterium]|nr:ABC transporter ATP-binding protein [Alphaproteobacteria bacterium]
MNESEINKEILFLKNITHIYNQDHQRIKVLDNINVRVVRGEMVALIGPSGTGKSTLLNIAGLLESPTFGSVSLAGKNCKNLNEDLKTTLRGSEIGFIFQSHRLFPEFTAIENVMIPQLIMGEAKLKAEKKSKELLSVLGLEKRLNFRPAKLSGGEAQRVAIARSLANSPNLVLADEPTGNLDPISAKNVFEILYKLVKSLNISCLIATHNYDLAKLMDRSIVLKNGSTNNN